MGHRHVAWVWTAAGLVVAVMAAASGAVARESCDSLRARLARIEAPAANAFAASADRQRQEIARTRPHAAACAWSPSARCAAIETSLRGMEANLARLEAAARRQRGGGSGAERNRILQAMAANRCGSTTTRMAAPPMPPSGGLLMAFFPFLGGAHNPSALPADRSPVPPIPSMDEMRRQRATVPAEPARPGPPGGRGNFRTLCVRTCDGYFWPVSFSVPSRAFARDAEICRAACPNMDVSLYVHRNPGAWSDAAVALDGTPYTELVTANRFRQEYNPACTCRPALTTAAEDALTEREGRSEAAPANFAADRLRGTMDAEPVTADVVPASATADGADEVQPSR